MSSIAATAAPARKLTMEPGHDARARKSMRSVSIYIQRNLISPFSARSEQIENRRLWLYWVLDRPTRWSMSSAALLTSCWLLNTVQPRAHAMQWFHRPARLPRGDTAPACRRPPVATLRSISPWKCRITVLSAPCGLQIAPEVLQKPMFSAHSLFCN